MPWLDERPFRFNAVILIFFQPVYLQFQLADLLVETGYERFFAFFSLARLRGDTSGKPSRACFFHCAICVGCTPYSAAISLAVFCPLMASKATLVFRSALYRFRCIDIVFLLLAGFSIQLFYLIDLSSFLVHPHLSC